MTEAARGLSRNVRQEMTRWRDRQARTQGARVLGEYVGDRGRSMAVPQAVIFGEAL
jgi:hypothetical protein